MRFASHIVPFDFVYFQIHSSFIINVLKCSDKTCVPARSGAIFFWSESSKDEGKKTG